MGLVMGLCRLRTHCSTDWYHKNIFGEFMRCESVAPRGCSIATTRIALGNAHDATMQDDCYTIYCYDWYMNSGIRSFKV